MIRYPEPGPGPIVTVPPPGTPGDISTTVYDRTAQEGCCCCPVDIGYEVESITEVESTVSGMVECCGHKITVTIQFNMRGKGTPTLCQVDWMERTNMPYLPELPNWEPWGAPYQSHPPYVPIPDSRPGDRQWANLLHPAIAKHSKQGRQFLDQMKLLTCPNPNAKVVIVDTPCVKPLAMSTRRRLPDGPIPPVRLLQILVRAYAAPNCKCDPEMVELCLLQVAKIDPRTLACDPKKSFVKLCGYRRANPGRTAEGEVIREPRPTTSLFDAASSAGLDPAEAFPYLQYPR